LELKLDEDVLLDEAAELVQRAVVIVVTIKNNLRISLAQNSFYEVYMGHFFVIPSDGARYHIPYGMRINIQEIFDITASFLHLDTP
jgi:hypothetical protein